MAGHKAHQLSLARCIAFGLWAVDHAEMAQDVDAVKVAMRVTEQQARVLCRALVEARKRPGRKPKDRAVRRFEKRAAGGALEPFVPAPFPVRPELDEPDVAEYLQASALLARCAFSSSAPRCGTGFATCSHQHLGIGQACEAGQCRVREHDAQVASGVEVVAHG